METKNNTFIFNLEWYAILKDYPEEVRLEVYEAIMRYASSGTLSGLKPLAKMAFSFIRKEMDYNRERYESTIEKRREAGRKGGTAKAPQANASDAKQNKQSLAKQANASDAKQNKQMLDLLSINDNDNDNVNVNELSSTTARARVRGVEADEAFIESFFEDGISVEAFCKSNCISPEDFRRVAGEVVTEWRLTGQTHESESEARRHLLNQARIKISNINKSKSNETDREDRFSRRRGTESSAWKPEDFTETL